MTILERLFKAGEFIHLLRFYLFHPDEDFTAAELRKRLGRSSGKTSLALRELVSLGCLGTGVRAETGEATYRIDPAWLLFPEFRALFMKAQLLIEHDLVRQLQRMGRLRLLVLAGLFVGERQGPTDVLIVGQVNRRQVARLLKRFERDLNQEVKYTVMTANEYRYRKDVGDRFLYDILERRHLVVVDTLQRRRIRRGTASVAAVAKSTRRSRARHRRKKKARH